MGAGLYFKVKLTTIVNIFGSAVLLSDYQESHIREEEEKLEEETQEINLEFHQQLVTEIQEALQFLQQHMEQVIGQTLLQYARGEAGKKSSDHEQDFKVWKWSIAVSKQNKGYLAPMESNLMYALTCAWKYQQKTLRTCVKAEHNLQSTCKLVYVAVQYLLQQPKQVLSQTLEQEKNCHNC